MRNIFKYIRLVFIPVIPLYLLVFCIKRLISRSVKFNIPVICIGNITTGGTGKTPLVIYLAKMLKQMGFSPGIISRGYRGTKSKEGAVVSDGKSVFLSPEECGDEPLMIAESIKGVPFAICSDRPKAICLLTDKYRIDIILMDDGFQNNSVYKDFSIIVLDALKPFGNGLALPAGDLRECVSSLRRSDFILINKCNLIDNEKLQSLSEKINRISHGKKIFHSYYKNEYLSQIDNVKSKLPISKIKGKKILIFTGIGNPAAFKRSISQYNPSSVKLISFHDHHYYNSNDIKRIINESGNFDFVITTEKDYVKLKSYRFNSKFYVLKISLKIKEDKIFKKIIDSSLREIKK